MTSVNKIDFLAMFSGPSEPGSGWENALIFAGIETYFPASKSLGFLLVPRILRPSYGPGFVRAHSIVARLESPTVMSHLDQSTHDVAFYEIN